MVYDRTFGLIFVGSIAVLSCLWLMGVGNNQLGIIGIRWALIWVISFGAALIAGLYWFLRAIVVIRDQLRRLRRDFE